MSTKKEAAAALAALRRSMRAGGAGHQQLDSIHRYMVELRKGNTALKNQVESLQRSLKIANDLRSELKEENRKLTTQASKDAVAQERIAKELQLAHKKAGKLERQIELGDKFESPETLADLNGNVRAKMAVGLFRKLRQRMKAPPETAKMPEKDRQFMLSFNVDAIATETGEDRCTLVGLFALACCLYGIPVVLFSKLHHISDIPEGRRVLFYRWMSKKWVRHGSNLERMESEGHKWPDPC